MADDVLRHLYVGEEDVGIWKYSAEPDGGSTRTLVDQTGAGGHLAADVEGLTIYYANSGAGYLLPRAREIANSSCIGGTEQPVHRQLRLISGGSIDAVTDTDGIDVTNFALGSQFPQGLFVAQDNDENFKLARWDAIDTAFGRALIATPVADPRLVGRARSRRRCPVITRRSPFDAANYVVWRRDARGQSVTPYSGADGNGNGRVDEANYGVSRPYSGQTLAAASMVVTVSPHSAKP